MSTSPELPPKLPLQGTQNTNTSDPFPGVDEYYHKQFVKIRDSNEAYKGKWNWYAFLFSWIWLFTKGAWGYALIMIGSLVLTFGSNFYLFVSIGWAIISGFRGTYIYYNVKVKDKQMPKSLF